MIRRFFHQGFLTWYFSDNGLDWYAEEKTQEVPNCLDRSQGKPSRDRKQQRENKRQF